MTRRRATLLTPFDPAALGNGSSRRASRWCAALATQFDVDVVVVPVVASGPVGGTPIIHRRVELPDDAARRSGAVQLMEPRWRDWMASVSPLPPLADAAPAWLGRRLMSGSTAISTPDVVVSFKMALAPMAADLAMAAGDVPLVVDLDDDESTLAADLGDGADEVAALERLLRGVASLATVLTAASPADAASLESRLGRVVLTAPNVVELPAAVISTTNSRRAMYVANFGYAPNSASARWLLHDVMPLVTEAHTLDIVGIGSEAFGGVGFVPDLDPLYGGAHVVLCPVVAGSGTSVKVIEAMSHGLSLIHI